MNKTSVIEKYFLFILLGIVIAVVIAIFYPFLTMVILSAAFAVVLSPLYNWVKKRLTRGIPWIASIITVILFLLCLCVPLFFIGTVVFNQTQELYQNFAQSNASNTSIQSIDTYINNILPNGFTFDTHAKINDLITFISNNITGFFTSTFNTLIMFILMVLSMFYILKDGSHWRKTLVHIIPLSKHNIEEILSKLSLAINRILKGSFFIAIVQGLLTGIGFTIFGIPNPALWGVVAGMASFVPTIGTSLVSVPAMIFLLATGKEPQAVGLLVWSMVLVGMIDNLLTPYVISKNTEIPSLFILFSILGGISLMGPVGLLIGPLVLSLLYSLISIYKKEVGFE
jgi:predicted PurR-regulated permease PerM